MENYHKLCSSIAESAFSRISQEMLRREQTVNKMFGHKIQLREFEGEQLKVVETADFISGLGKLEINDFDEQHLK